MFLNHKSDFFLLIFGRQNKISESNQLMRPQPQVSGIKNCQEKSILKEKLELIRFFFEQFVKST